MCARLTPGIRKRGGTAKEKKKGEWTKKEKLGKGHSVGGCEYEQEGDLRRAVPLRCRLVSQFGELVLTLRVGLSSPRRRRGYSLETLPLSPRHSSKSVFGGRFLNPNLQGKSGGGERVVGGFQEPGAFTDREKWPTPWMPCGIDCVRYLASLVFLDILRSFLLPGIAGRPSRILPSLGGLKNTSTFLLRPVSSTIAKAAVDFLLVLDLGWISITSFIISDLGYSSRDRVGHGLGRSFGGNSFSKLWSGGRARLRKNVGLRSYLRNFGVTLNVRTMNHPKNHHNTPQHHHNTQTPPNPTPTPHTPTHNQTPTHHPPPTQKPPPTCSLGFSLVHVVICLGNRNWP